MVLGSEAEALASTTMREASLLSHHPASLFGELGVQRPFGTGEISIIRALRLPDSATACCTRRGASMVPPGETYVLSLRERLSLYALPSPPLELSRSPRLLSDGWLAAVHTSSLGLIWAEVGFASIA
jgi:hypothetical protein